MIVAVTVDDGGGVLFNGRRQSRDSVLNARILSLCGGTLYVSPYTEKLFADQTGVRILADERFLEIAAPGDFCFSEGAPLVPYQNRIEKLIVYRWNRAYPSDRKLDLDVSAWKKVSETEFAGSSHEKITEEVYIP